MAQSRYKTHIQREKPAAAASPSRAEKPEEPVADAKVCKQPIGPGLRLAFRIWLAGVVVLAIWLLWDLLAAVLFR
jgi:hypothetical protein